MVWPSESVARVGVVGVCDEFQQVGHRGKEHKKNDRCGWEVTLPNSSPKIPSTQEREVF